jgi:hypothetical protein
LCNAAAGAESASRKAVSLSQDIVNLPYVPDAAGWTQANVAAGQGHGWLRGRVNNMNELELKGSIVSDNNPASAG